MRTLVIALMAALLVQFGIPQANACGDKTMRVKTGLRYYQTLKAHPSNILIHSTALPSGKAAELSGVFNRAGQKAVAVDDVGSIRNRLAASHYDLVLTRLADAPQLQKQVESFSPKTVVVPVLYKPEEKAAAQQYKIIVNNPKNFDDFLIAVVRVMDSRSKKS